MVITPTEVVIPPAPPCPPVPEPGGVTSAAVQPPGSTGEPITRVPTNESSEYPDSITDEEVAMLDEQEEEERLIRNGGNGIPFGPVSFPLTIPPSPSQYADRRMAFQGHSYLRWLPSTLAENAWSSISTRLWSTVVSRYTSSFILVLL
jgi:hypothetical protein